jgi:peptidyl-prolyl cis-trans isomerase D
MILERFREMSQGTVAKIILSLIIIPFALFGADYYFKSGGTGDAIAKVEGQSISQQQFNQVLQQQLNELKESMGANAPDPAQFNNPQMRLAVLQKLIDQTVVEQSAKSSGLVISDQLIAQRIAAIDAFKKDGKFSQSLYEQLLKARGMTPVRFEQELRDEMSLQMFQEGVLNSSVVSQVSQDAWAKLASQTREISVASVSPDSYISKVKVEDKAVRAWYDSHIDQYRNPERVQLQYVVLTADAVAQDIVIALDEVKKAFDAQNAKPLQPVSEERRAAHILLQVKPSAPEAERQATRKKAEQLLAEVKAHPAQFAQLAQKYSQDPGSAKQGGDLGFFGRGVMAKPFEEAVFALKTGETSDLVQTEFGYHIIRLTEVKGAQSRTLAEATPDLTRELRHQRGAKKFVEAADNFSNLVFEQSGSLKPAADALKLEVQQTTWVSRNGAGAPAVLNNAKFIQAAFAQEVVRDKRNTSAIEVAPNTLVAARALNYEAATPKPFEEVSGAIRQELMRSEAEKMAEQAGKDALAALIAGKTPEAVLNFTAAQTVTRQTVAGALPNELVDPAFKADPAQLPAYAGAALPGKGFGLVRVSKVAEGVVLTPEVRKQAEAALRSRVEQEETASTVASLRRTASISMTKNALDTPTRANQE